MQVLALWSTAEGALLAHRVLPKKALALLFGDLKDEQVRVCPHMLSTGLYFVVWPGPICRLIYQRSHANTTPTPNNRW